MIVTDKKKLVELLSSLNIENNDNYIIIHCSSFFLGKIKGGIGTLYSTIKKKIGTNNTLIFPSFTYSYRRKKIFDISNTPCDKQIGILSEIARKDNSSFRNDDPLFSLVSIGLNKEIIKRDSKMCFGNKSVYEKLFKKNFYILSLGVEFTNGISEFMHLEKLAKVPYRYDRIFKGYSVLRNKRKIFDSACHFVRKESFFKKYKQCRQKFGEKLIEKKICKNIDYGYGSIFLLNGKNFLDFSLEKLNKNNLIMTKKISN